MFKVEFNVRTDEALEPEESVFVCGSIEALGEWLFSKSLSLNRSSSDSNLWLGTLILQPSDISKNIQYRYFVGRYLLNNDHSDLIVRTWESFPTPREINCNELKNSSAKVDTVVSRYGTLHESTFISDGWLSGQTEVQLRLHPGAVVLYHSDCMKRFKLKVSATNLRFSDTQDEQEASKLSIKSSKCSCIQTACFACDDFNFHSQGDCGFFYDSTGFTCIKIQSFEPESLLYQMAFYEGEGSSQTYIGKAYLLPVVVGDEEKPDNKFLCRKVPIISHRNVPVGYVCVDILVIAPLHVDAFDPLKLMASNPYHWIKRVNKVVNVGHRGMGSTIGLIKTRDRVVETENTIASFKAAYDAGADLVEFDVQLTKDRVPVIFHNFQVSIKAPAEGTSEQFEVLTIPIKDLLFEQLLRLRTLETDTQDSAVTSSIPTLSSVFKDLDVHLGFNIEIKYAMQYLNGGFEQANYFGRNTYIDVVLECILREAGNRCLILSSFDPDCCCMLRNKQNKYQVLFLSQGNDDSTWPCYHDVRTWSVESSIQFAACESFAGVAVPAADIIRNTDYVHQAKSHGLKIFCWGLSSKSVDIIDQVRNAGIDGIICDDIADLNCSKNDLFIYHGFLNDLKHTSGEALQS